MKCSLHFLVSLIFFRPKSSFKVVVHHILKLPLYKYLGHLQSLHCGFFCLISPWALWADRSDICISSGQGPVTSQCIIIFLFDLIFFFFIRFSFLLPIFLIKTHTASIHKRRISPKATSSDICINQAEASPSPLPLTAAT